MELGTYENRRLCQFIHRCRKISVNHFVLMGLIWNPYYDVSVTLVYHFSFPMTILKSKFFLYKIFLSPQKIRRMEGVLGVSFVWYIQTCLNFCSVTLESEMVGIPDTDVGCRSSSVLPVKQRGHSPEFLWACSRKCLSVAELPSPLWTPLTLPFPPSHAALEVTFQDLQFQMQLEVWKRKQT